MPQESPIACALSAADRPALLRFEGEREAVDALVAAERACCGFFEFATSRDGDHTELEVRTPAGGEPLLRALVAGIVAGWEAGRDSVG
jgi:hypothetical protein